MVNRVIIQIPSLSWRLVPNFIKVSAGIGLIALGAACSSPGANALSNPNYFLAKVNKKAQVMSGQYNPAGFSSAQVKSLVSKTCRNGQIAAYSQSAQSGLVAFSATCGGGFSPRYSLVTFEKTGANKVLLEATGSDGVGNIIFTQFETEIGSGGARVSVPEMQSAATPAPAETVEAPETKMASAPRNTCRNSITIYCKDNASGGILPNVDPEAN